MSLNVDEMKKIFDKEFNKKKLDDKYFIVAEGKSKVRLLPATHGRKLPFLKAGYHKLGDQYYNCPKMVKEEKCPVCEKTKTLYSTGKLDDAELARQIKVNKKFFFNVISRAEEAKGPRILTCGIKLFEKILGAFINEEIGDVTDPKTGFDLNIDKSMKAGYFNYDASEFARKQSVLSEDQAQVDEWLAKSFNLDEEVKIQSYNEIKAALLAFLSPPVDDGAILSQVQEKNGATEEPKAFVGHAETPVTPKTPLPAIPNTDPSLDKFQEEIKKLREQIGK
jgi:hypothetical protein